MANIKSQIKRNRQNEERRRRNKSVRSALKTRVRRFNQAIEAGDKDAAEQAYEAVQKAFDKAASRGVIHRNKAANQKSRLARHVKDFE
jgi:small subunit ribosomal protein S20